MAAERCPPPAIRRASSLGREARTSFQSMKCSLSAAIARSLYASPPCSRTTRYTARSSTLPGSAGGRISPKALSRRSIARSRRWRGVPLFGWAPLGAARPLACAGALPRAAGLARALPDDRRACLLAELIARSGGSGLAGRGRRGLAHAQLAEERLHRVGRLRADVQPVQRALLVELHLFVDGLAERVVGAQLLDRRAVAARARVEDADAVRGAVLAPDALQSNPGGHPGSSFVLWVVVLEGVRSSV